MNPCQNGFQRTALGSAHRLSMRKTRETPLICKSRTRPPHAVIYKHAINQVGAHRDGQHSSARKQPTPSTSLCSIYPDIFHSLRVICTEPARLMHLGPASRTAAAYRQRTRYASARKSQSCLSDRVHSSHHRRTGGTQHDYRRQRWRA